MKKYVIYLITIVFALSAVFTACKKDKEDKDVSGDEEKGVVINGVRWATRNVDMPGTFAANPEDAGMFYQLGRKVGWSTTNPLVNSDGGTIWDDNMPLGDTWEQKNDPCPCGWRVPTIKELRSLVASGSSWDELNGVTGRFFGSGEHSIFLPSAGGRNYTSGALCDVGSSGYYWSSSISFSDATRGLDLSFYDGGIHPNIYLYRSFGESIRCVADQ
ncbi:MAG: hypothetical protein FWG84_07310 [Bacteroidales bacterium]|nr:hypothetical protein [Bacteroidales bacterium]